MKIVLPKNRDSNILFVNIMPKRGSIIFVPTFSVQQGVITLNLQLPCQCHGFGEHNKTSVARRRGSYIIHNLTL
jgi:hypothetical protein